MAPVPPMPDDDNPPGRRFALRSKEITRTDAPARPGDGTAISVELIHEQNRLAEERRRLGLRGAGAPGAQGEPEPARGPGPPAPKEIDPTEAPARTGDGTAISVELIHRQNRLADERRGPELVALPRRRVSKRTRDFFVLALLAVPVVGALLLMLPRSPAALAIGLGLVGMVVAVLAWVMFGVMDDY